MAMNVLYLSLSSDHTASECSSVKPKSLALSLELTVFRAQSGILLAARSPPPQGSHTCMHAGLSAATHPTLKPAYCRLRVCMRL